MYLFLSVSCPLAVAGESGVSMDSLIDLNEREQMESWGFRNVMRKYSIVAIEQSPWS